MHGAETRIEDTEKAKKMKQSQLNWITGYIWGIADDVLRDLYVRGKYRALSCR